MNDNDKSKTDSKPFRNAIDAADTLARSFRQAKSIVAMTRDATANGGALDADEVMWALEAATENFEAMEEAILVLVPGCLKGERESPP